MMPSLVASESVLRHISLDVLNMGWLRSVGSIRLWVSFAEYRLFYRALLQKRPIILSILLTEATPYQQKSQSLRLSGFVTWMAKEADCNRLCLFLSFCPALRLECTDICCNTLHHTATHCNTLQHISAHCNTLQHT